MKRFTGCQGLTLLIFLILFCISSATGLHAQEAETACTARIASIQGRVTYQTPDQTAWQTGVPGTCLPAGTMVRVGALGRAAVMLHDHTLLRLDQNSSLRLAPPEQPKSLFMELLKGAAHFFSRTPRRLKVTTPFLNANIEGTEFLVQAGAAETLLTIFEGQVLAANPSGELVLTKGQSATAGPDRAPALKVVADPRESVRWTLHYPPVLAAPGEGTYGRAGERLRQNDPAGALDLLEQIPAADRTRRHYLTRASILMSAGRARQAAADLDTVLGMSPGDAEALALLSMLAVVQSRREEALELAAQAVAAQPDSPAARLALSYARQAQFDVHGALQELEQGVAAAPGDALLRARLAELYLSTGDLNRALATAERAAALDPYIARTQTVLGFARLAQIKTRDARQAFETAMELDPADPLPRLGLGLAIIREGDVQKGREQIEVAVALDPGNALIRSYLGKAYFEEKRDKHAAAQYTLAKELDAKDPTPWFYDALRKQSVNRPVEALHDLQKSIELNDNRAVYRSRLLLDEDLAARSASLGRIYHDLGFEQLALVEGWKSVNTDPANYSAHRFLADSYAALPRHEIARVSELLQSQLLQPININPIDPRLSLSDLPIMESSGPSTPGYNEFAQLFNRNRVALQVDGMVGDNDTWGEDIILSGVWNRTSWSLGQLHFETDGFRPNNDRQDDVVTAFVQSALTHRDYLQAEYRYEESEYGDLLLRFDPENYDPEIRQPLDSSSIRVGYRHAFRPGADFIASFIHQDLDTDTNLPDFEIEVAQHSNQIELQQIYRVAGFSLVGGAGYLDLDDEDTVQTVIYAPPDPPFTAQESTEYKVSHGNLYFYSYISWPAKVTWTLGLSADLLDDEIQDIERELLNPKLGVTWNPWESTTIRAAGFRTLKRYLIGDQTVEPTQVAGFNQFFDDGNGTEAWRYGVAVDQKLRENLLVVERLDRGDEYTGNGSFTDLKTYRVPLGIHFFHPAGFNLNAQAIYFDQSGNFGNPAWEPSVAGDDQGWIINAGISYRLPRRLGMVSLEGKNITDAQMNYEDSDHRHTTHYPERRLLFEISLSF